MYKAIKTLTTIKLKHLYYKQKNGFRNYLNLEIGHFQILIALIYSQNEHIITCSRKGNFTNFIPFQKYMN